MLTSLRNPCSQLARSALLSTSSLSRQQGLSFVATSKLGKTATDCVLAAIDSLKSRGCPPQVTTCELFVGTGHSDYEGALDVVAGLLEPKALVGCAVSAIAPRTHPVSSPHEVALRVRVLPEDSVVVPFSHLPKSAFRVQVGRYNIHTRDTSGFEADTTSLGNFASLLSGSHSRVSLPAELEDLKNQKLWALLLMFSRTAASQPTPNTSFCSSGSATPPSFILFGDKNTEGFLRTLDDLFPQSSKVCFFFSLSLSLSSSPNWFSTGSLASLDHPLPL